MAVNRDHVAGLLIKASLALHFVDILGSVCHCSSGPKENEKRKAKAKTKTNRKQKTKKSGASLILRSTTVEPHTQTHTCVVLQKNGKRQT